MYMLGMYNYTCCVQCVEERDVTVQSLCREQEQQRARYEGRIAALTGQLSDAQARTKELQVYRGLRAL